jgi:hypothetical protein
MDHLTANLSAGGIKFECLALLGFNTPRLDTNMSNYGGIEVLDYQSTEFRFRRIQYVNADDDSQFIT